mmetsp:Transcript_69823/g.149450  ORF Transcript_69823/g.149450 Transcript_69823/m.149450 type:complete len:209 (+) Transcript_69823:72-698(+)
MVLDLSMGGLKVCKCHSFWPSDPAHRSCRAQAPSMRSTVRGHMCRRRRCIQPELGRHWEAVQLHAGAVTETKHEEAVPAAAEREPAHIPREAPLAHNSAQLRVEGLHGACLASQGHDVATWEDVKGAAPYGAGPLLHSALRHEAERVRQSAPELHDATGGGADNDTAHHVWAEAGLAAESASLSGIQALAVHGYRLHVLLLLRRHVAV